jgi:tape measure domain-containing protein
LITLLGYKVDDSGREQYNKGIDQTKQKQQSMTASFLKANIIMGAASKAIGAAFGFIRDSVIGATAETERYRVALGTMMGDQEKANKIIRDLDYGEGMFEGVRLSDFYGTANAIGGLQNMVTFGMEAEKAGDVLARLGDIAQGDSEAFVSMSNAMGQVFAKGKADSVALKQFATKGFDVVGEVAKQTGKSREEIQKSGVTYEQTAAALRSLTDEGGKYHGMLAKQMNTLGGILKQFASLKAAVAEAIGFGINDDLKDMLKYILEIARAGQDAFVGKFVRVLKEVIHWIFQIIIMFKVLGYRLEDMGDALAPVKQFFSDLKDAAGDVLTGIMTLFVELGRLIVTAFEPIQAFASPIIKELGTIARDVFTGIAGFIRPLIPIVSESAGFFGGLGQAIAGLLRPALIAAVAIRVINTAIAAYKTVMMGAKAISFLFSGDLLKIRAGLMGLTGSAGFAKSLSTAFGLLTGKLSIMKAAADGNRLALFLLNAQMLKAKIQAIATAAALKIKAVASLIAAKAQAILNAIMSANPIGLIILGVVALIAAIILLVKNWDKVGPAIMNAFSAIGNFFKMIGSAIASFFKRVWSTITDIFSKIVNFVKNNALNIINVLLLVFFFIPGIAMIIVRLVIKHWDKIKSALTKIFTVVVDRLRIIWGKIAGIARTIVEAIKSIWLAITGWFAGLWSGIVDTAMVIWDTLKGWFSGLVEGIKNIWNGIIGFFAGLWEALKQGPAAAIEYIRDAFFGLFNTLQEKLFGFINKIKEGWEKVKGFFGDIAEGAVNFITGGNSGGGQMQPAYATAGAGTVGPTSSYAYNSTGGNSTVNANTSINVNVPQGTPQEQSEAITRQINAQFDAKLAGSINSSRANIPSPEVRRH